MSVRKSLLEILNEKSQKAGAKRRHLPSFLAEREEIQSAINSHWPLLKIWEVLTETQRISMSYSTFSRLVKTVLKAPKEEKAVPSTTSQPSQIKSGFVHNPNPDPKDLI